MLVCELRNFFVYEAGCGALEYEERRVFLTVGAYEEDAGNVLFLDLLGIFRRFLLGIWNYWLRGGLVIKCYLVHIKYLAFLYVIFKYNFKKIWLEIVYLFIMLDSLKLINNSSWLFYCQIVLFSEILVQSNQITVWFIQKPFVYFNKTVLNLLSCNNFTLPPLTF